MHPIPPRAPLLSLESKLSVRQDSELQPKFGAWLRANSRGTEATVTARSRSRVLLEELKRGLEGRDKAYTCQLILSLRYADTHSELVMKQRSLHPDRINAIPARGGHKAAVSMTEHARLVMSSSSALTPHLFAEVGEVRESDSGLFEVSITTKFSTNITSPSHGNRTMFWRAEVMVALGDEVLSTQCDSPAFEYHPRPPKIGDAPRIHTVISDGRPGDLIILYGDRLGVVHKNLECHLSYPDLQDFVLKRETLSGSSPTTSCFTTRIPASAAPANAHIFIRDSVDGVVSNELPLQILRRHDQPVVPLAAPLLRGVSKRGNGDSRTLDNTWSTANKSDSPQPGGACRNTNRRKRAREGRADRPYDVIEDASPPFSPDSDTVFLSPDSEYEATPNPHQMPPATPNPYESSYSQTELYQTAFDGHMLGMQPTDDWLLALVDRGSPSMFTDMNTQELKECRTDFTRSLSEEWAITV